MAKLTANDFNTKYESKIVDNDDLLIELMEDFSDSVSADNSQELESLSQELEALKMKYDDLKEKYKMRFLNIIDEEIKEESVEDATTEEDEGLKEEEVVDVTEI